jgi:small GTP-binding protein
MSTTQEQLQILLDNYFSAVDNIETSLIFDRDGLLVARKEKGRLVGLFEKKEKNDLKSEQFGAIAGVVEQTLNRIKSYEIGEFGNSTIDTDEHRLVFTEAGPNAILLSVYPYDMEINQVLPYCFLVAEKIAIVLEGKMHSLTNLSIPNLQLGFELGIDPANIMRGPVKYDSNQVAKKIEMRFKLIVVGDATVGKTSLINQFVTHTFVTDYRPTLGISITSQVYRVQGFDESRINFMVWDVAGQKFFQRVRKHYYSHAHAAFIVYDVTSRDTFDHVEMWYNDMQGEIPKVPIVLVGNKTDLSDQRVVSLAEGREKAKALKCLFMETSAKTGENVRDAFNILGIGLFFKSDAKTL